MRRWFRLGFRSHPCLYLLAAWLFTCGVSNMSAPRALAAEDPGTVELDPQLREILRSSAQDELIPILLFMRDQGVAVADRSRIRALPRAFRRAEAVARLRALADDTQLDILRVLEIWASEGRALDVRSLWLVNGIAVTLEAALVPDLLTRAEVRRIQWDPPIPLSESADEVDRHESRNTRLGSRLDPIIPWQLTQIHAPECWAQGYDGTGVVIGLVDTGIDYNHPDLQNHLYVNPNEIPSDSLDNDNNGKIDDWRGWDFISDDNDPYDEGGDPHGTRCAGILVGDGTNGTRTGVAPGARILPIRAAGNGQWSDTFDGLAYAVEMGVDIISMSQSQKWRFVPKPDYSVWRAITDNEWTLGFFHANSIGNEGDNQETDPIPFNVSAPGNCPSPWLADGQFLAGGASSVVACGATSQLDYAADFSSRGPSDWEDFQVTYPQYPYATPEPYRDYPYLEGGLIKPDVAAPGEGTSSTERGGIYAGFNGTSCATPAVAGTMAILLQARPTLTPEQMAMILQTTAVDLGDPGKDSTYGSGRIECYAALQKALGLDLSWGTIRGTVIDAVSLDSIPHATIEISTLIPTLLETNASGRYSGSVNVGLLTVEVSAFGHETAIVEVTLAGGATVVQDVALNPLPTSTLRGIVRDLNGAPLPGARVRLINQPVAMAVTDTSGNYAFVDLPAGIPLAAQAFRFNYATDSDTTTLIPGVVDTLDFAIAVGLSDDFELDQGWTRFPTDNVTTGFWERVDPVATFHGMTMVQPDSDYTAAGTLCYLTQNCTVGAGESFTDVDFGTTTLVSPLFDATVYAHPTLEYRRWFSNDTGSGANDVFKVEISSNAGVNWIILEQVSTSNRSWMLRSFTLENFVTLNDSMLVRFVTSDVGAPSIVEAAIDDVRMVDLTTDVSEDPEGTHLQFTLAPSAPNPFAPARGERATIRFTIPDAGPVRLAVFDIQGRRVTDLHRGVLRAGVYHASWDGRDASGHRAGAGVYLYLLEQNGRERSGRLLLLR